MIHSGNALASLIGWIAQGIGLSLEFTDGQFIDSIDEEEVAEELRHGRD